jgi:hypothetical protein
MGNGGIHFRFVNITNYDSIINVVIAVGCAAADRVVIADTLGNSVSMDTDTTPHTNDTSGSDHCCLICSSYYSWMHVML